MPRRTKLRSRADRFGRKPKGHKRPRGWHRGHREARRWRDALEAVGGLSAGGEVQA